MMRLSHYKNFTWALVCLSLWLTAAGAQTAAYTNPVLAGDYNTKNPAERDFCSFD